jgi:DNA-binding NarL/FixJ family response regulator
MTIKFPAGSSYFPCYLKANYLFDSTINETIHINDREKEFLSLCTSELTYKEIAEKMNVKTRTVDNYRDNLFEKLNVVSRTGLVLYAIKNKIVKL